MTSPFTPDVFASTLIGDGQAIAFEQQWVWYIIDAAIPSDPNRCIIGFANGTATIRSSFDAVRAWLAPTYWPTPLDATLVTGERLTYVSSSFGMVTDDSAKPGERCFLYQFAYGPTPWAPATHVVGNYVDIGYTLWGAP